MKFSKRSHTTDSMQTSSALPRPRRNHRWTPDPTTAQPTHNCT
jgi:hypothetical protein